MSGDCARCAALDAHVRAVRAARADDIHAANRIAAAIRAVKATSPHTCGGGT